MPSEETYCCLLEELFNITIVMKTHCLLEQLSFRLLLLEQFSFRKEASLE
jgi:hypothetical protein